eukprot:1149884-Rhodomonas_salina.7
MSGVGDSNTSSNKIRPNNLKIGHRRNTLRRPDFLVAETPFSNRLLFSRPRISHRLAFSNSIPRVVCTKLLPRTTLDQGLGRANDVQRLHSLLKAGFMGANSPVEANSGANTTVGALVSRTFEKTSSTSSRIT